MHFIANIPNFPLDANWIALTFMVGGAVSSSLAKEMVTPHSKEPMEDPLDQKEIQEWQEYLLDALEKNERRIFRICHDHCNTPADVADLHHDIVYQIWKSYPSFRNESSIGTWMHRIASNIAIQRDRRKRVKIEYVETLPDTPSWDEEIKADRDDAFSRHCEGLIKTDRTILGMLNAGYPHKEIGEMVGMTENAVNKRIARLMKHVENFSKRN